MYEDWTNLLLYRVLESVFSASYKSIEQTQTFWLWLMYSYIDKLKVRVWVADR